MTAERRMEIFSKEVLTIADIQELFGCDYNSASVIIRNIRRKSDRLGKEGRCMVADYIDAYNLPIERYTIQIQKIGGNQ